MKRTGRSLAWILVLGAMMSLTASAALSWNWNTDYTGSEEGTLLLWKFENTGTEQDPLYGHDSSGNGNHATFSSTYADTGVDGRFNKGFYSVPLEGTDPPKGQDADVGRARGGSNVFDGNNLTVEVWYKPLRSDPTFSMSDPPANSAAYVFSKYGVANYATHLFFTPWHADNRLRATVGNGSAELWAQTPALTWVADQWYHLAMTYSSETGTLQVFRDGDEVASKTEAGFGELQTSSPYDWHVGNRGMSRHGQLPGYYDNFRVTNIPEPSVFGLLLLGAGAMAVRRRRSR